ncbi:MAG: TRAP transporter large permease subunit [Treponema sp.]|nr:TRAP transporter large permease subunit [Treponema sp.]
MLIFLPIFFLMLALGMPIAFALGIGSIAFIVIDSPLPAIFAIQRMFGGTDSFPLLAIPFFILAGHLMSEGGVVRRLLDLANVIVGHRRGGLGGASIVGSMAFAAVSGSAVADAAAMGPILIPAMKKAGYDPEYAVAINSTSPSLGLILPPSIAMVLMATVANASVRDLFFANLVPGLLTGFGMLFVNWVISVRRNYPKGPATPLKQIPLIVLRCVPALFMPFFIVGGILFGVVTATEAAVIAVVYSLIIGAFFYRELTPKKIYHAFIEAGLQTAVVLFIIANASILSGILSFLMMPQALASWALANLGNHTVILIFVVVVALIVSLVIDVSPAVILIGAIFAPVAMAVGMDMLHFGAVVVYALIIGIYTPPVGTTLIISTYIAKTSFLAGFRYCIPFLILMLTILGIMIFFPQISSGVSTFLFH